MKTGILFLLSILFTSTSIAGSKLVERLLNINDPTYNDALDEMSALDNPSKEKLMTELQQAYKERKNAEERANAISALGDLSMQLTDKKKVIGVLLIAMNDKSEFVRQAAISSLQRSGAYDTEVLKAFTMALEDKNSTVVAKALDAFIGLGPKGKGSAASIQKLLKHKDEAMRDLAKMALERQNAK